MKIFLINKSLVFWGKKSKLYAFKIRGILLFINYEQKVNKIPQFHGSQGFTQNVRNCIALLLHLDFYFHFYT